MNNEPVQQCPDCSMPMKALYFAKQVHELYCERCDLSIDRQDKEHRGGKEYGEQENKWEKIRHA